ncbi:Asp23/Gls24 family envelope stress response protein [Aggregatilinea lenta]|uniref:Asp23/Gls24 family envelope stress response protein n=1 Tax=Aggregatilinea lenta TaxID=913108 RepID=UPI000E5BA75E|nr:Asp23/Gls24 family envelope stress response protein [Aggregatilinea lenta]
MTTDETSRGMIEISPNAIASLAGHAVLQTYGVVGMASPNLASDLVASLTRDPHRGIQIRQDASQIIIDVYVVIEYGTRIASVANSLINAVRYTVEQSIGIPVGQVNVHVQGLRVSRPE